MIRGRVDSRSTTVGTSTNSRRTVSPLRTPPLQAPYTCARRNTVNRIRAWWRANIIATLPGSYSRLDRLDGLR
jgi:hypothetical protein